MPTEKPPFDALVQEHRPFIRRTLAQLGVSMRDLADVEQEVFRGAERGLSGFDPSLSVNPETAVRGWLFGICERQAANHRRAELKRGEILFANEELDYTQNAAPSVEEQLIDQERHALLMQLLAALEPNRRAVVIAYELEGISMADVAANLAIPVNTAWNRLRLGREDLRTAWKRIARSRTKEGALPTLGMLFGDASWTAMDGAGVGPDVPGDAAGQSAAQQAAHSTAFSGSAGASAGAGSVAASASLPVVTSLGAALAVGAALLLAPAKAPPAAAPALPVAAVSTGVAAATPSLASAAASAESLAPSPAAIPAPDSLPSEPEPTETAAGDSGDSVSPAASAPDNPSRAPQPTSITARLQPELNRIQDATTAIERGDLDTAKKALASHERSFADGRLAGEREVLFVRAALQEGRWNEARDRVRAFVAAHPDSPFRAQLEGLVQAPR